MRILLVDDSESDADMIGEAIEDSGWDAQVSVAVDGEQAMERLHADPPDLLLLDLNLPRVDGHEVLRRLRAEPGLRHLPVVVLSTSHADKDVAAAFEEAADAYLTKPEAYDDCIRVAREVHAFWDRWGRR